MLKGQNLRTDTCSPLHEAAAQVNNPPFEPGICCRKEIANAKAKKTCRPLTDETASAEKKHVVGIEMRQNFLATNTHTAGFRVLCGLVPQPSNPSPGACDIGTFFFVPVPAVCNYIRQRRSDEKKKEAAGTCIVRRRGWGLATAQATPLPSASPSAPYGHTSHVDA